MSPQQEYEIVWLIYESTIQRVNKQTKLGNLLASPNVKDYKTATILILREILIWH